MEHGILFYLQPFAIGLSVSVFLCVTLIFLVRKRKQGESRTSERHIHNFKSSRMGGVAIIFGTIIPLILSDVLVIDRIAMAIIVGGVLIMIFGIIDDIQPLSWKVQFFFQIVLALSVFIIGIKLSYITIPFGGLMWAFGNGIGVGGLLFLIFWMLAVLNAVNWSDGMDGQSAGTVLIGAIAFFFISLQPHVLQPPLAIIFAAFAGSVFGFLVFNFPPARIMAGSSGAFFMGYIIALLAIAAGAKIGTALLVLIVPLSDFVWVIIQRIKMGKKIFHADSSHLHHKMMRCGWSVQKILTFYYSVTIICAIIAVSTQSLNKLLLFLIAAALISVFIIFTGNVCEKE